MSKYDSIIQNENVQAFLALIRHCEGAGYTTLFGGGIVENTDDHPRIAVTRTLGGKPITSTAAGAYQFLSRTWDECVNALGLTDFSPPNQDRAALYLIERRRALPAVMEADWTTAIERCNREWASLPGSPYGQPTKSLAYCLAFLQNLKGGGAQATDTFPEPTKETTDMAPFILAAIPSLIQAAPSLIRLFGKGEQAETNAKAAEIAVEIAKSVTEQVTAEGAVNAIQSDPVVATAYAKAIESKWYELTGESGGGGIEGARKANAEASKKPIWTNPAFLVTLLILPMIYMTVYGVIFGDFSNDIKIMVISAVMSLGFGSVAAYYFGTSASSQKKTDMLNEK